MKHRDVGDRPFPRGDPAKVLERRQKIKAREIAEIMFKLPESSWEEKLKGMYPEWQTEVRFYLNAFKQKRNLLRQKI